jgi:hypothetical protein
MPRFLVDSQSLLGVRDTLGRLHNQLLAVPTVVGGYDGLLGSRALEGELARFAGTWHFGILEISTQIEDMMDRLAAAAAAYRRIEHQVGHGARPGVGSGTTVVGAGPPRRRRGPQGSGVTVVG